MLLAAEIWQLWDLVAVLGNLTLSAITAAMVERPEAWKAVSSCGKVMLQKEDAERARGVAAVAPPRTRRETGVACLLPWRSTTTQGASP